jgi:hypothetical protein
MWGLSTVMLIDTKPVIENLISGNLAINLA